ncbi:hypothetical protein N9V13_04400 [Betaproteobacteria bacterium]|nr:hypothetical protein [Betaproteobacteria bacterium]
MNHIKKLLPSISKILVSINLSFFLIVFVLKTEASGGISWFLDFSWLSTLNVLIDIALGDMVSSTSFICIWFIFTILLSLVFFLTLRFNNIQLSLKDMSSQGRMAIDIDDLNNIDNAVVFDKGKDSSSKRFSDSLSEVEKETERKNNKTATRQNSHEVNDLMATIPPDVAEKFKDLKDTLEMIDTKKSENNTP